MVLHRTMNTQATPFIIKGYLHHERVLQIDGECAVDGSKRVVYSTKKGSSILTMSDLVQ